MVIANGNIGGDMTECDIVHEAISIENTLIEQKKVQSLTVFLTLRSLLSSLNRFCISQQSEKALFEARYLFDSSFHFIYSSQRLHNADCLSKTIRSIRTKVILRLGVLLLLLELDRLGASLDSIEHVVNDFPVEEYCVKIRDLCGGLEHSSSIFEDENTAKAEGILLAVLEDSPRSAGAGVLSMVKVRNLIDTYGEYSFKAEILDDLNMAETELLETSAASSSSVTSIRDVVVDSSLVVDSIYSAHPAVLASPQVNPAFGTCPLVPLPSVQTVENSAAAIAAAASAKFDAIYNNDDEVTGAGASSHNPAFGMCPIPDPASNARYGATVSGSREHSESAPPEMDAVYGVADGSSSSVLLVDESNPAFGVCPMPLPAKPSQIPLLLLSEGQPVMEALYDGGGTDGSVAPEHNPAFSAFPVLVDPLYLLYLSNGAELTTSTSTSIPSQQQQQKEERLREAALPQTEDERSCCLVDVPSPVPSTTAAGSRFVANTERMQATANGQRAILEGDTVACTTAEVAADLQTESIVASLPPLNPLTLQLEAKSAPLSSSLSSSAAATALSVQRDENDGEDSGSYYDEDEDEDGSDWTGSDDSDDVYDNEEQEHQENIQGRSNRNGNASGLVRTFAAEAVKQLGKLRRTGRKRERDGGHSPESGDLCGSPLYRRQKALLQRRLAAAAAAASVEEDVEMKFDPERERPNVKAIIHSFNKRKSRRRRRVSAVEQQKG